METKTEDAEETDEDEETPEEPAPLTRALMEEEPVEVNEPADDPSEKTNYSHQIVPPDWGYKGKRRPDGMIIGKSKKAKTNEYEETADFFDVTVVGEWRVAEAIRNKKKQYENLLKLAEDLGFKAKLHVIPVGVRGFMPVHTKRALKDLGVRLKDRKVFETKAGRIAKQSGVGIAWARRRSELPLDWEG